MCTCDGEKAVIGYDPGTPDGDKSAIIYGKRGKNGTVEVVCVRMGKPEPRRTVFDSFLKKLNRQQIAFYPRRAGKASLLEELKKNREH